MYLIIVSKTVESLSGCFTKRETVTVESLEDLEHKLSWYKDHSYKFETVYKIEYPSDEEYNKAAKALK